MFKESPLREILTERIKEIPERELEALLRVVKKMQPRKSTKKSVMAFAGSWKQFDTQSFVKNISTRRKKANRKREV